MARMTPAGVELLEDGQVLSTVRLDYQANDLELPAMELSERDADWLLASVLGVESGTSSRGVFSTDSLVPDREPPELVPAGSG